MYVARFDSEREKFIQAAARIDAGVGPTTGEAWDEVAQQITAAAPTFEGTIARRITLDQSGRLHQIVSATVPATDEMRVRATFARLTRIERLPGATISLPQRREESDAWLEDVGALQFSLGAESFSVLGVPLACDFRLAPWIEDLLLDALRNEYRLSYQLHVRRAEIDREHLRTAHKNLLALRKLPGTRQHLLAWQEELTRNLRHASSYCEEYLAVDSEEVAERVASTLVDRFREHYGRFGFPPSAIHFAPEAHEESLVIGVHSHDLTPHSPVELCGLAISASERDRFLGWRPSSQFLALTAISGDASAASQLETAGKTVPGTLPEPYSGDSKFAFVSYKRMDLERIVPILSRLPELGMPVWFDRGIPGGAEWDEVIEERLSCARILLLFTSQAAVESKYVRREVKFADTLGIPILTVLLEDVELRHGLRMLLTQYQMVDARTADFAKRLEQAVNHLL